MTLMGMKSITALVLPDEDVALPDPRAQHREGAQPEGALARGDPHVPRPRGRARERDGDRRSRAIFEEPHFITFGAAYEKRPRFSAGAYSSIVKRLESFQDVAVEDGLRLRESRADRLLALDDEVVKVVEALKAHGLVSPYLKYYVVARVNFLRFKKDGTFDFDDTIEKLTASARKIDPAKVRKDDIAKMGGAPAAAEDE